MPAAGDKEFGEHIRNLRQERGLTQESLAERSTLSVDAVRGVERAAFSPTLGTIRKIATGLNVSLKTLFTSLQRKRRDIVEEICDYLAEKSRREVGLAWRVIRAMFKEPDRPAGAN